MTLPEQFNYFKEQIQDYKRRETCLDLALKCKNDKEKIYFIENDFDRGIPSDYEDEGWLEMKYSFFEQYALDEDDYEFVSKEIDTICWCKEINSKDKLYKYYEAMNLSKKQVDEIVEERNDSLKEAISKFGKIFPDVEEIVKKFKLNIFSLYFEENVYKHEIEFLREHINEEKKSLRLRHPEHEIPNLDTL